MPRGVLPSYGGRKKKRDKPERKQRVQPPNSKEGGTPVLSSLISQTHAAGHLSSIRPPSGRKLKKISASVGFKQPRAWAAGAAAAVREAARQEAGQCLQKTTMPPFKLRGGNRGEVTGSNLSFNQTYK